MHRLHPPERTVPKTAIATQAYCLKGPPHLLLPGVRQREQPAKREWFQTEQRGALGGMGPDSMRLGGNVLAQSPDLSGDPTALYPGLKPFGSLHDTLASVVYIYTLFPAKMKARNLVFFLGRGGEGRSLTFIPLHRRMLTFTDLLQDAKHPSRP